MTAPQQGLLNMLAETRDRTTTGFVLNMLAETRDAEMVFGKRPRGVVS